MKDGVPPGRRSIDKYRITGEVKSGALGTITCSGLQNGGELQNSNL